MSILWRTLLIDLAVKTMSMLLAYLQKRDVSVSLVDCPFKGRPIIEAQKTRLPSAKIGRRTKV